jgi:AbrB family looped-hinge helix DNA binding protein
MSTDNGTETTRITRKGQVTIPKGLREEYGLEEGDEVVWQKAEDGIRVRKATRSAGRGMLVDDGLGREARGGHLPRRKRRGLSVASRSKRGTHPVGTSRATGFYTGFACHPAPTSECGDWHSSPARRAPAGDVLASYRHDSIGVGNHFVPHLLRRGIVKIREAKRLCMRGKIHQANAIPARAEARDSLAD